MYTALYHRRLRSSRNGLSIQYDPVELQPYSVQAFGCGHYFQSPAECVMYCKERKWVKKSEVEDLIELVSDGAVMLIFLVCSRKVKSGNNTALLSRLADR